MSSYSELEKSIINKVRFGLNAADIKLFLSKEGIPGMRNEDVSMFVDTVIADYPNYELIQRIMRSKLIIDVNDDNSKVYISDLANQHISTITKRRLGELFNPKANINSKIIMCNFRYVPNEGFILKKDEETGEYVYNTFSPPTWYKEHFYSNGTIEIKRVNSIPKIYDKYLKHLTNGHEASYNYILDWMANAVRDRNLCILATIGKSGIGKGVLGEIMRGIFGSTNYRGGVRNEIFKNRFNSQLIDKKLVYLDEIKIETFEQENKLKLLINDFIEVERKGVDAEEVRNYTSFYLSSNNLDALKISGDDRRFSIVELTETPLLKKFSSAQIEELLNQDNIDQFSRYLYYREYDKTVVSAVFKTARTNLLRSSSLTEWEAFLLEEYAYEHLEKWIPLQQVSEDIANVLGNVRRPPGKKAFYRLQSRFPERISVKYARMDGGRRRYEIMLFADKEEDFE